MRAPIPRRVDPWGLGAEISDVDPKGPRLIARLLAPAHRGGLRDLAEDMDLGGHAGGEPAGDRAHFLR
jgi:hypothetical protein